MIRRRNVLALLATAALAESRLALAVTPRAAADGGAASAPSSPPTKPLPWKNWSGSQSCVPGARVAPASVEELQALIAGTTGTLRPVGAGHSFSPLVPTDGTLVSLARLQGLVSHDAATQQATVWAGTRLGDIGEPLDAAGQALINMPDIDEQALAGCLATATHGTGAGLSCLSDYITALELVDGRGNLVRCDATRHPEVFAAARVSLGALGIITQVTLQNTAPYRLKRETIWQSNEELFANAEQLADRHRNFELYLVPFTGMGFSDTHDFTDEPVSTTERLDGNEGVRDLQQARDLLKGSPRLRRFILGTYMRTLPDEVAIERSWRNYSSERNVRFNEMEYHLPREHGIAALREIIAALETGFPEVFFPIEFRYVKGDALWLSPFHGRDTCSIAVHRYFEEDYKPLFAALEPILRRHHGRPHWGKLNTLGRDDLRALYPRWDDFAAVRRELDPDGRFLNPYLRGLFGAGTA